MRLVGTICAALAGFGLLGGCNSSPGPSGDSTGGAAATAGTGAGGTGGAALCPDGMTVPHNGYGGRFAWTLTVGTGPGGIVGSVAGSAGTSSVGTSACYAGYGTAGSAFSGSCQNSVPVAGTAEAPVLVFDDGSELAWDPRAEPMVRPPQLTVGDRVWAYYTSTYTPAPGLEFGYTGSRSIEVRTGPGEQLLFLGFDNTFNLGELGGYFEVSFEEQRRCRTDWLSPMSCTAQRFELRDLVVATTPPQRLPYAEVTEVETPRGTFEVLAAQATSIDSQRVEGCADGVANVPDSAFAASWLGR